MFGKRKISDEEAGDVLTDDTFTSSEPLFNQVQKEELIEVTLDQIVKSPLNPRQIKNPKFEEIKESIRNRGLDQPPKLTKREPSQDKWEIADGGNSRVDILRELYNECKEQAHSAKEISDKIELDQLAQKFFRFKARVIPWEGEINALSGHVVENEAHSPMLFIEKALAAKNLKEMFEVELRDPKKFEKYQKLGFKKPLTEEQALGTRPLARLITQHGWVVNAGNLTRYQYAAETLVNLIPDALWSGAGHDVVARIKKLGSAYLAFIKEQLDDKETATDLFDTFWAEALSQNDDENIHSKWADVRKDMESSISSQLDLDREFISREIDRILQGKAASPEVLEPINKVDTKEETKPSTELPTKTENNESTAKGSDTESKAVVAELNVGGMEEVEDTLSDTDVDKDEEINTVVAEEEANFDSFDSSSSRKDKIIHGLNISVSALAEEVGLSALVEVVDDGDSPVTKILPPRKMFSKDDGASFVWLKLLCLFESEVKPFSESLYKAFGKKANLEHLLMRSQNILFEDPKCRKHLKLIRKVEDQMMMLMDEMQNIEGGA